MPDTHLFGLCCEARERTESVVQRFFPNAQKEGSRLNVCVCVCVGVGVWTPSQPLPQARKNLNSG